MLLQTRTALGEFVFQATDGRFATPFATNFGIVGSLLLESRSQAN